MKTQSLLLSLFFCFQIMLVQAQQSALRTDTLHIPIGCLSEPEDAEISLKLSSRFQQYKYGVKDTNDHYDRSIYSPKSATFSRDGSKFYVQSLEGFTTSVYDAVKMKRIKVIRHEFRKADSSLFRNGDSTVFDYHYHQPREHYNHFKGKPVESCLSHDGRYLWVSYYRRDFDKNAVSPSAIAIIDTKHDSIVRVMPSGPLPKMVACSPDNKYLAVTHWGDNTVGIIDISGDSVHTFAYKAHVVIDYKASNKFEDGKVINRDRSCGNCLRGTVFTPDSNYLLVGKMGAGGIAVVDLKEFNYLGTIRGMKHNVRHLHINQDYLYLSSNMAGYVQKAHLKTMLDSFLVAEERKAFYYRDWRSRFVGVGARTIELSSDGKYMFAAVNNQCKVAVVRTRDMKLVAEIDADAFPVGMALSPDDNKLVVTSQGKNRKGGNSVMIFDITKK